MIIAEIGNNHLGDIESFKEHIRVAKECGADMVKGQAFLARDIWRSGSMPRDFYLQCELTLDQYIDMIYYSRALGIELFYSVFSKALEDIHFHQKYHKIAGGRVKKNLAMIENRDVENMLVSIPEGSRKPALRSAKILHVSTYMTQFPGLENIKFLSSYYGRRCGYSDHTIGIDACVKAVKEYDAHIIEKHFTLSRDLIYKGIQFRDGVHGALPSELEKLCNEIKGGNYDLLHL